MNSPVVVGARRVLYRGKITKGPSLHSLIVSLTFVQTLNGWMEIPVTFGIDPIVTGSAGDFSWNISAFWMVVHSLGREDGDYVNWKIVGEPERRESAQTILRAFGVSYEGQRIPRIRFEIEYSTSGQAGRSGEVEVCIYD